MGDWLRRGRVHSLARSVADLKVSVTAHAYVSVRNILLRQPEPIDFLIRVAEL